MYDNYEDEDSQEQDPSQPDLSKLYFKFDVGSGYLYEWVQKTIDHIMNTDPYNISSELSFVSLPVNDSFPSTVSEGNSLMYLGNNQYNEIVWKNKYFIRDKTQDEYIKHLQSHIKHFVAQPSYYKGLFDILN